MDYAFAGALLPIASSVTIVTVPSGTRACMKASYVCSQTIISEGQLFGSAKRLRGTPATPGLHPLGNYGNPVQKQIPRATSRQALPRSRRSCRGNRAVP